MNINDLNAIANDLMSAFFDGGTSDDILQIANKYQIPLTGKIFRKAMDRAIELMDSDDISVFDNLTPANRDRLVDSGLMAIGKKFNATLGKDFSKHDGGLLLSNELLEKIMDDLPSEKRAEFEKLGYVQKMNQDPFQMLDDSLGVPFFTSLEGCVKIRVSSLSDADAAGYISRLASGLQTKHNWVTDEWVIGFFYRVLGAERFKLVMENDYPDDGDEMGVLVFDDLLTAMGRHDRREDPELGAVINRDDLLALDKVFRGTNFSCAELAELCRRKEDEHRKG